MSNTEAPKFTTATIGRGVAVHLIRAYQKPNGRPDIRTASGICAQSNVRSGATWAQGHAVDCKRCLKAMADRPEYRPEF